MPLKSRLIIRIIWNSEFTTGSILARHVYSRLCRDVERPASRGLGIPVYFHSGPTPAQARLPESLDVDSAESTVVVVLLDTSIRAQGAWRDCIRTIESQFASFTRRHLFLPVACEDKVLSLVEKTNCIRLFETPVTAIRDRLVSALTHELARLLLGKGADVQTEEFGTLEKSYAPVKLFISHSKHGAEGTIIAMELRDYGRQHFPVATFYDSNDIAAGANFEKEIQANVAESAMVVVHTDTYSDRSWCRKEILLAKRHACPVLLVNAVTNGEDRLFPYIGNAPVIRWLFNSPGRCEIVIDAALREVLRNVYFIEHAGSLKAAGYLPSSCVEIGTAPETLTYLNLLHAKRCDRNKRSLLLYPDPPLGDEEIEVLENLNPSNITAITPTAAGAQPDPSMSEPRFKGRTIGLSISNSTDLSAGGMDLVHLEDAMVESARHLLAQGASLAYGGDLRPGGFTTILCELVRNHNRAGSKERIRNFLAWPIYLHRESSTWREYLDEIQPSQIPPPPDLDLDTNAYIDPDDAQGRYVWARCLTAMRLEMSKESSARILLGGQVAGFKGKYPGLLEEALIELRARKPVYIIGGFGGCARPIIDALKGYSPDAFTESFQSKDPLFGALKDRYRAEAAAGKTEPIDYVGEVQFLHSHGVRGLDNGLTDAENEILFTSKNLPEVVHLLLKGLTKRLS